MNIKNIEQMNKLTHRNKDINKATDLLSAYSSYPEIVVSFTTDTRGVYDHTITIDKQLLKDMLFSQLHNDKEEFKKLLNKLNSEEEVSHETIKETKNIRNTISDLF